MARKEITTSWDRENRNNIDENFKELYNEYALLDTTIKREIQDLKSNVVTSVNGQVGDVVIEGGGGSGVLTFLTLSELQSKYPNGTTQPVWVIRENSWYYWDNVVIEDTTPPIIQASLSGGTYNSTQTVALSANEASDIFYTTNGSTPTETSLKYTSPITISTTTTLKFFGKDTAGNKSTVQTIIYTIDPSAPDTTPPILTITAGGTFTGTKQVTMSVNETADIYYTLDGSTPTTASAKYTNPLTFNSTTTLKAFARDTAGNTSAVQTVVYTLDSGSNDDDYIVWDTFNRGDTTPSLTGLGMTDTGQTWFNQWNIGNGQILNNQARVSGKATFLVNAGVSDCTVEVKFLSTDKSMLILRSDIYLKQSSGKWSLHIWDGDTDTELNLGESYHTVKAGDIAKVKLEGDSITIYHNGTQVIQVSETLNLTDTHFGIASVDDTVCVFDDFKISKL